MKIIEGSDEYYDLWEKRLKNFRQKISSEEYSELKEKVLSCIDSIEMREYLSMNLNKLDTINFIRIITGALKPIDLKLNLFTELAKLSPHPFDKIDSFEDFEPYVELYRSAFADMQFKASEKGIFLLRQYDYEFIEDEMDTRVETMPFFSVEQAIQYIKNDVDDWLYTDELETTLTWFTIERWVGYDMKMKGYYTVSKYGEIWDYCCYDNDRLSHSFGYDNSLSLNLPVPFKSGDIITLDCRPFAPLSHAVVVSIGDNIDCCSVQCLYFTDDGKINIGALKHSDVFDSPIHVLVSPLYKAEVIKEDLPDNEKILYDISKEIRRVANGNYGPEVEWNPFVLRATYDILNCKRIPPEDFLEAIRKI